MRLHVPGHHPWMIWARQGAVLWLMFVTLEYHFKQGGLPPRNSMPARWHQDAGWSPMRTVTLEWDCWSLASVMRALLASASFRSDEALPEAVAAMVPDPAALLVSLEVMES